MDKSDIHGICFQLAEENGNISSYHNVNGANKIRPEDADKNMNVWKLSFYPLNLKLSKNEIISLFIEHNNLWQTNYLLHVVVIWDKRQKAKVEKVNLCKFELPWTFAYARIDKMWLHVEKGLRYSF